MVVLFGLKSFLKKKEIVLALVCVTSFGFTLAAIINDSLNKQVLNKGAALSAQASYDSLNLIIAVEKPTYALGEPISVNLTLENVGNNNLTLQLADGSFLDLSILSQNGSEVLRKLYSLHSLDTVTYIPLRPKDSFKYSFIWGQLNQQEQQVEPGKYNLTCRLIPFDILGFCPEYDHYADYFTYLPIEDDEFSPIIPEPIETGASIEISVVVTVA